jgi:hypothetical protein
MEKENSVFLEKSEEDSKQGERTAEMAEGPTEETEEGIEEVKGDVFKWKAPEFEHLEKSTTWYWGSMIVAVLLMGVALWQKNFLFAVFIMLAELALFLFAGEKPKVWNFKIDDKGVTIENHKLYKYADITLYDIHEFSDEYHELVLQTKSKVHHYIKMFIRVEDEAKVTELLDKKTHRGEIEVTFLELLERLIGF